MVRLLPLLAPLALALVPRPCPSHRCASYLHPGHGSSTSALFASPNKTASFIGEMQSLEELILSAESERSEGARAAKVEEIMRRQAQLKRVSDKEYEAYWARKSGKGVRNKERATFDAYYSLRKGESLQSKLARKADEWDYSVTPSSPRAELRGAAPLAALIAGALLVRRGLSSEHITRAARSTLLDARVIRQNYGLAELLASVRTLSPSAVQALPDASATLSSLGLQLNPAAAATVLVYWRPSDAASSRALAILRRIAAACPELRLVPVLVPKYPSERGPSAGDAVVDKDQASYRSIGCNALPTVVILAPPSLKADGKVLFALEGERALMKVLACAIAAAAGSTFAPGILAAYSATPSPLPEGRQQAAVVRSLSSPSRVAVDQTSGRLFVSDTGNHRVLEVAPDGTVLRVFGSSRGESGAAVAGCGLAELRLNSPMGLAVDAIDRALYIADFGNDAVRRVSLDDGSAVTLGAADVDRDSSGIPYDFPELAAIEETLGRRLADFGAMSAEEVSRAVDQSGLGDSPLALQVIGRTRRLRGPVDVVKSDAVVYVSAAVSRQVWRVDGFAVRPAMGSGLAGGRNVLQPRGANPLLSDALRFVQPAGLASLGSTLIVVDADAGAIRSVDLVTQQTRSLVGGDRAEEGADRDPLDCPFGDVDAAGHKGRLQLPGGACAFYGSSCLVADSLNNKVKRLVIAESELGGRRVSVQTVLGPERGLSRPAGVAADQRRGRVYVADAGSNRILVADNSFSTLSELQINFESIK